jgi:hypothetical protein
MGPFTARPARFDLNLPLTFVAEGEVLPGHCVNVSQSGMLVQFNTPIELFTTGTLSLTADEYILSIHARVARTQGNDAGMAFFLTTPNDHRTVAILLEFATVHLQPDRDANSPA